MKRLLNILKWRYTTGNNHLAYHGASFIGQTLGANVSALLANLLPDYSFGPRSTVPGAVLPPSFTWRKFHTLKVEIGISQTWGGPGGLKFKANAWRQCPGVQYVLCIHISPEINVCQYRLNSIVNGEFEDPRMLITDIDDNSVLEFDARRLLGLPSGANLPAGFNDPILFNLFDTIELNLAEERQDAALLEQAEQDREDAASAAGQPPRQRRRLQ
ncbi:hypothetical protein V7S43_010713 [Phytophthora oleae]|uniref:Uncharacterized protein n=1 Tax=Phytophthora oleae TaxID=2107226 RepID=A0ABD3FFT4_9STRA